MPYAQHAGTAKPLLSIRMTPLILHKLQMHLLKKFCESSYTDSGVVLSISLSISFTFYCTGHKPICFSVSQHPFTLHLPRQTNQHHCVHTNTPVSVCTTACRISKFHVDNLKQISSIVKLTFLYVFFSVTALTSDL